MKIIAKTIAALLALPLLASPMAASAQAAPPDAGAQPAVHLTQGDVILRHITLRDGGSFDPLKLHYLSVGTPHRNAQGQVDNAVLLLHGTTGSAQTFMVTSPLLFQPGQLLDQARYYTVIPDGIGAGGSTKPSDGLHGKFPRYGYRDQVDMDVKLLHQIGVDHLRLVLGTSMGGMQTWLIAEQNPALMDAAVAVASLPIVMAGRNMLWRDIIIHAIHDDPLWHGGDYDAAHAPSAWRQVMAPLFAVMTRNATVLQKSAPSRDAAETLFQSLVADAKSQDASDIAASLDSSYDYDPAPALDAIKVPFLALNFADDLLNPIDLNTMPLQDRPAIHYTLLPGGYGHQTLTHPEIWQAAARDFLQKNAGW